MNYYDKYGKITLSKGTTLYHWSNHDEIELLNNIFLCLDNSFWSDRNKFLHKYKLKQNIDLILTIKNNDIIEKKIYSSNRKNKDYELITTIYNEVMNSDLYVGDDVSLKMDKPIFSEFCDKLSINNYEGLFNYIDSDFGQFEIVIFDSNNYLKKIETKNYADVKLHKLNECKRRMLSNKINYHYPHHYEYKNKREHNNYPSIFYYICKKNNWLIF